MQLRRDWETPKATRVEGELRKDLEKLLEGEGLDSAVALSPEPISEEEYDEFKSSALAETDEARAEREKLMDKGVIGVEVDPLDVGEDSRIRGDFRELLPDDELSDNTADW